MTTELSKGAATGLGKAETLAELRQQAEVVAQQLNEARSRLSTAAQRQVAVVKRDSCTICGICASSCPNDAIAVTDVVAVDASRCSGCGACVYVCPSGAIQLEKP